MITKDLTGLVFGCLTVVGRVDRSLSNDRNKDRSSMWLCRCSCGKEYALTRRHLRRSPMQVCRHSQLKEETVSRAPKQQRQHHGMSGTPEYLVWGSMKARCLRKTSKDYPQYGERGITVCERWLSFDRFIADMGLRPTPHHSLDRIDNNGNYEPSNCRWSTVVEQANNKRSNKRVVVNGQEMTIAEASRLTGEPASKLYRRLALTCGIGKGDC